MEFSLGLVEVSSLGNAIMMLDEMTKAAEVEFVACERRLGGRLVTIVVRGSVSAVTASVAAGVSAAKRMNCLKASEVIARPHPEIFKFLHLDEEKEAAANAESAATHTGTLPEKTPETAAAVSKTDKKPSKSTAKKRTAKKPAVNKQTEAEKASDIKAPSKRGRKKQS